MAILAAFDRILNDKSLVLEGRRRRQQLEQHSAETETDVHEFDDLSLLFDTTPIIVGGYSNERAFPTVRGEDFVLTTIGLLLAAMGLIVYSSYQEVQRRRLRSRTRPSRGLEGFLLGLVGLGGGRGPSDEDEPVVEPRPAARRDKVPATGADKAKKKAGGVKVAGKGGGKKGSAGNGNGNGKAQQGQQGGASEAGTHRLGPGEDKKVAERSEHDEDVLRGQRRNVDDDEDEEEEEQPEEDEGRAEGSKESEVSFTVASWQRAVSQAEDSEEWSSVKSKEERAAQRKTASALMEQPPAFAPAPPALSAAAAATAARQIFNSKSTTPTKAATLPAAFQSAPLRPAPATALPVSKVASWASLSLSGPQAAAAAAAASEAAKAQAAEGKASASVSPSTSVAGGTPGLPATQASASASASGNSHEVKLQNMGMRSFPADGQGPSADQAGMGFGSPSDPAQRLGQLPSLGALSLDIMGSFGGLWGNGQSNGAAPGQLRQNVPPQVAAGNGIAGPGAPSVRPQPVQQPGIQPGLSPGMQPIQPYSLYSNQGYTPFAQPMQPSIGMYTILQGDMRAPGPGGMSVPGEGFPPQQRGPGLGSSSSDFDMDVDAASGLSPNAPSFNPNISQTFSPAVLMGLYSSGQPMQPQVQGQLAAQIPGAPGLSQGLQLPRGVPGLQQVPAGALVGAIQQSLQPGGPVLDDRDLVSITLLTRCACLMATQTQRIKVISTTFGGWDLDHALVMLRSTGANNQEVWSLSFQVPRASTRFVYKYGAVDAMGHKWEEMGQARFIPLQNVRPGEHVHVDDVFSEAMPVY